MDHHTIRILLFRCLWISRVPAGPVCIVTCLITFADPALGLLDEERWGKGREIINALLFKAFVYKCTGSGWDGVNFLPSRPYGASLVSPVLVTNTTRQCFGCC